LRALLALPDGASDVSAGVVEAALKSSGRGMRKSDILAALAHLERAEILLPGGARGSRLMSPRLMTARAMVRGGDLRVHIDDAISALTNDV
jgi:hypothetical protein